MLKVVLSLRQHDWTVCIPWVETGTGIQNFAGKSFIILFSLEWEEIPNYPNISILDNDLVFRLCTKFLTIDFQTRKLSFGNSVTTYLLHFEFEH